LLKGLQIHSGEQILDAITLSAGIVETPEQDITAADLLLAADKAMYIAKQAGRDRITIHETSE